MHPLIDEEKQKRARKYNKEKRIWSLVSLLIEVAVLALMVATNVESFIVHKLTGVSFVFQSMTWAIVLLLGFQILLFIPGYQANYILEKKYGFMKQSFGSWMIDNVKALLLSIVLAWIVLLLLGWVVHLTGKYWWIVFAVVLFLLEGVIAIIFPVLVLPIFHKYTPIDDDELTSTLKKIMEKAGLKVLGFFKEDSSKKTSHDNAFFTGFGKTRRIILYDNLIENYTKEEIAAVIAHEAAHRKKNHILKLIIISLLETTIISLIIHLIFLKYHPEFFNGLNDIFPSLFLFLLVFILLSTISGIITNVISRYFEYEADINGVKYIGSRKHFISMLAKLANRNLSEVDPPKWVKILYMTHPPIAERIEYIEKIPPTEEAKGQP